LETVSFRFTSEERMMTDGLRQKAMLITVRLQPKSSQNRLEQDGETYKAWVSAPPLDGAANEALIKLVAKHFGVAPSKVEIVRGHTSRSKMIKVSKD
jgi:uncharacterized protein (TIGR00251 family)